MIIELFLEKSTYLNCINKWPHVGRTNNYGAIKRKYSMSNIKYIGEA